MIDSPAARFGSYGGPVRVNTDRLRGDLELVSGFGATGEPGGVSRTSFSPADRRVRAWLAEQADRWGLAIRTDGIGNLFLRLPGGGDGVPVWAGSHLDSVPTGGVFDGALGSLAALEVARRLVEERVSLRRPVEVVVCSYGPGESQWFVARFRRQ